MLTLHHLRMSRSSRVIWLLEALGLRYALVVHERGPDSRALPDLAEAPGRGKAPVLLDGELVLTESSAILRHVAGRYGGGRFVPEAGTAAHAKHDEWLDFAEASLMPPFMMKLIGLRSGALPPGLDRFASAELGGTLGYMARELGEKSFLVGSGITLADMQMSFCVALLDALGELQPYPALQAYWRRLQADAGCKRAIEVGGPLVPAIGSRPG